MCLNPWCQSTRQALAQINQRLRRIDRKLDKIMSNQSTEQGDIDSATSTIEGEVSDLGTKDTAIQGVVTQILALEQAGADTTKLRQAVADLLTAQGADDSTVAALTAAANPAPVTPSA